MQVAAWAKPKYISFSDGMLDMAVVTFRAVTIPADVDSTGSDGIVIGVPTLTAHFFFFY